MMSRFIPERQNDPLLGGFAALVRCFVLRFTQTAVAEIQVKTATAAARTNAHLQSERQLENAKTLQNRRKSTQQNHPGRDPLLPRQNIIPIDIAIGRGTRVDLPVRPSRPHHDSAMKSEIVARTSRIHQSVIT